VTAREVNEFLAEVSGSSISAKDFRTFRASATALAVLTSIIATRATLRKKALVAAAEEGRQDPGQHAQRGPFELHPSRDDLSL
jgi:hypothetical protein